jgi:hypothetical protein
VTVYRVPAREAAEAILGLPQDRPADPGRWCFGLAASYESWPAGEYELVTPRTGLPLFHEHEERRVVSSGFARADLGAARRFHQVPDLGLVALIEVTSPSALFSIRQGELTGLSVCAHLDDGADPVRVHFSELSLTSRPADAPCRIISHGRTALCDWELLTGERPALRFAPLCELRHRRRRARGM